MEGEKKRRERRKKGGERGEDVRYFGWVSTPCNLSSLVRTTSCDAGRSST